MRRLGADAADDIVAETFLLAFRQRGGYDTARGNVLPWLYGIATNLLGRHRRDEIRLYRALARTGIDPVIAPFTDQVDERVTATAASRRLAAALAAPARRLPGRTAARRLGRAVLRGDGDRARRPRRHGPLPDQPGPRGPAPNARRPCPSQYRGVPMNELDLLTRLRDEVPLTAPSPGAQRAFRAGLTGATGPSRPTRSRHRLRPSLSFSPLLAGATALAVGVTAGIVVLALPSGRHPSVATATGTAQSTGTPAPDGGASSAGNRRRRSPASPCRPSCWRTSRRTRRCRSPPSSPDQWVYRRIELYRQPLPSFIDAKFNYQTVEVENTWMMADGAHFSTTGSFWGLMGGFRPSPTSSSTRCPRTRPHSTPTSRTWHYPNPNATTANKATAEFSDVRDCSPATCCRPS